MVKPENSWAKVTAALCAVSSSLLASVAATGGDTQEMLLLLVSCLTHTFLIAL